MSPKHIVKKTSKHKSPDRTSGLSRIDLLKILEKNAVGIIIIDRLGIIKYINRAAGRIFNVNRKNIIGTAFGFSVPAKGIKHISIKNNDGKITEVGLSRLPVKWNGKPGYQISVIEEPYKNVVEKEEAKSDAFLHTAIDNLPLILYYIDDEGKFRLSIGAGLKSLALNQNEVAGQSVFEIYADFPEIIIRIKEALKGKSARFESHVGDSYFDNYVTPYINSNGRTSGVIGVALDITDRKLIEKDFRLKSAALQAAANAIVITDIAGKIIWGNKAFCKLTGYTTEEVLGKNPREVVKSGKHDKKFYHNMWETILEGKIWHDEIQNRRKDGSIYFEEMTITPLFDERNNISHFIAIKQDISDRKKSESDIHEYTEDLRRAQSLAHVGSWKLNIAENKIEWTDETYKIFEIPKGRDLTQEDFLSFVHPGDRERVDKAGKELMAGMPYDIEHRIIAGERVKWVHELAELERNKHGKPIRLLGTVQDITKQKHDEERIHLLNSELEDRISYRTQQLLEANHEMEAFSYSVSHDLRAPLRSINGFSNILLEETSNKLSDDEKGTLNNVIRSANRMGQLIDDLLSFSRMSRSNIKSNNVNMHELVNEISNELTSAEKERKIEINIQPLISCKADYNLLRQVWINLISNSLKYSRAKEITRIEIGSKEENGELVYFIKDNGVGFDMKYSDKLFGVFQRLHSLKEFEGTGIGLALCKRIITRHNGRIWAEAKPDLGATFYF